jgi:hypothetical protein
MAKQVKYRRGTSTQHGVFTGVQSELTVDIIKNVVIVHDGVTPGGWPAANATLVNTQITALTANNASQSLAIAVLQSNAATQANLITSLQSNAATQQASINAFVLTSNADAINAGFAAVNANVTAANLVIETLTTGNLIQAEGIDQLRVSISNTNANVAAANAAIESFVSGTGFALIGQLDANITAVNTAISTIQTTFATNVAVAGIRANITAANVEIASLQANIIAANAAIRDIALSPVVIGAITDAVTDALATDAELAANIALVNASLAATNANVTAANVAISSIVAPNLLAVSSNIVPLTTNTYSLGTSVHNWKNLYLSGNIIANRLSAPEIEGANNELNIYSDWAKDTGISIYSGTGIRSVTLTSDDIVAVVANVGPLQQEWIFEASGSLRFPDNSIQVTAWSGNVDNTGNFIFANDDVSLPPGNTMTLSTYQVAGNKESKLTLSTATKSTLYAGNNLELGVGYGTGFEQYWQFGADGSLTFPDATVQSTANIMLATFTMTNATHWTESVTTIGAALNQLAARIYAIENP